MLAAQTIQLDHQQITIAGGMESMSQVYFVVQISNE
jgi:acetyl-CoA acetyltransferase